MTFYNSTTHWLLRTQWPCSASGGTYTRKRERTLKITLLCRRSQSWNLSRTRAGGFVQSHESKARTVFETSVHLQSLSAPCDPCRNCSIFLDFLQPQHEHAGKLMCWKTAINQPPWFSSLTLWAAWDANVQTVSPPLSPFFGALLVPIFGVLGHRLANRARNANPTQPATPCRWLATADTRRFDFDYERYWYSLRWACVLFSGAEVPDAQTLTQAVVPWTSIAFALQMGRQWPYSLSWKRKMLAKISFGEQKRCVQVQVCIEN